MKLQYLCKTLFKQPATPMTPSTAPSPLFNCSFGTYNYILT